MSASKPLSYPTWEFVLPYLNFDTRVFLSRRYTGINTLNERVPIRINQLEVRDKMIIVGRTKFKIGVIQIHYYHDTPDAIRENNSIGGFPYDVDRYGFKIPARGEDFFVENEFRSRRDIGEMTREKDVLLRDTAPGMFRRMTELRLNRLIRDAEKMLLPFEMRANNAKPPYTHYLQLKITDESPKQKLEKFTYKGSISEAMEHLFKKLFTTRSGRISNLIVDRDANNYINCLTDGYSILSTTIRGVQGGNFDLNLKPWALELKKIDFVLNRSEISGSSLAETVIRHCQKVEINGERNFTISGSNNPIQVFTRIRTHPDAERRRRAGPRDNTFPNNIVFPKTERLEIEVRFKRVDRRYVVHIDVNNRI